MVLVKNAQDLFDHVAGLFSFSPRSEAITELPRFLIEICSMPLQTFDRTVTQDEKVGITVFGHPSLVLWSFLRVQTCQITLSYYDDRGCAMGWLPTLSLMIAALHDSNRPQYILSSMHPSMGRKRPEMLQRKSYAERRQKGKSGSLV